MISKHKTVKPEAPQIIVSLLYL